MARSFLDNMAASFVDQPLMLTHKQIMALLNEENREAQANTAVALFIHKVVIPVTQHRINLTRDQAELLFYKQFFYKVLELVLEKP